MRHIDRGPSWRVQSPLETDVERSAEVHIHSYPLRHIGAESAHHEDIRHYVLPLATILFVASL
eukprot:2215921-Amphidinium_carterae.1